MHSEKFQIEETVAEKINLAIKERRRIIAVGTTTVRALESAWSKSENIVRHGTFETDIFIKPGYKFKVIDSMLTNFHLPKSTLILLVSAFAGKEMILRAYKVAIEKEYKFFSFGDAMFIH
jgi:S-adenosylmethionine:tRNA ribosyltransferase-isomerase